MKTRSKPMWRYDPHTGILHVRGRSFIRDLRAMKRLFDIGRVPYFTVEAIVYVPEDVDVPTILRGHVLSQWLLDGTWPDLLLHFTFEAMKRTA